MAVETQSARLLLAARKAGVDFSRTLTFGRQNYFPRRRHLRRALDASGLALDVRAITALPKGYAEPFFFALGAQSVDSIDASPYQQATLLHDLNRPVPVSWHQRYSAVFDGGTTEHIYHFTQALDNAVRLLAPGGHFISITTGNNMPGHGFYQISPELFFRVFSAENGFKTRAVLLIDVRAGGPIYRVTDPAELRGRVEYVTRRPFFIAVIAQKIAPVDGIGVLPQQSDYQAAWAGAAGQRAGRFRREVRRLGAQLRGFLGRHLVFTWQNRGLTALADREFYSL